MLNRLQKFGKKGESIAIKYLKKNGYTIVKQNYRSKYGEVDIIAKDKDTIVFVEVKARRSDRFGDPKWAVTYKKQQKISLAAINYLKVTNQSGAKARFDVIAISGDKDNLKIEIVKNAFELASI